MSLPYRLAAAQESVGLCTGCGRRANGIVPLRQDRVVLDVDLLRQLRLDFLTGVVVFPVECGIDCESGRCGGADVLEDELKGFEGTVGRLRLQTFTPIYVPRR